MFLLLSAMALAVVSWAFRSAAMGAVLALALAARFGTTSRHGPIALVIFIPLALLLAWWDARGSERALGIGRQLGRIGAVAASQAVVASLFLRWSPEFLPSPISSAVAWIVRLAGADAVLDGKLILARGATDNWPLPTTWDAAACTLLIQLFVGAVVWMAFSPQHSGRLLRSIGAGAITGAYLVVRLATLMLLYVYLDTLTGSGGSTRFSLFTRPFCIALSLLPLMVLLGVTFGRRVQTKGSAANDEAL